MDIAERELRRIRRIERRRVESQFPAAKLLSNFEFGAGTHCPRHRAWR
jgi:hypothetical protein